MLESKNAWGVESLRNRARQRGRQREDKIKPAATKPRCGDGDSAEAESQGEKENEGEHKTDSSTKMIRERSGGRTGQVGAHTAQARTLR